MSTRITDVEITDYRCIAHAHVDVPDAPVPPHAAADGWGLPDGTGAAGAWLTSRAKPASGGSAAREP